MGIVICRHLKGSAEGALCMVVNNFIKDMNGFSIKICMSRHYEACPLYFSALQEATKENTSLDCV
jgi:hypothetical protein